MGTSRTAVDRHGAAQDAPTGELERLRLELAQLREQLDDYARTNVMLRESAEQFVSAVAHDVKNPLAAIKVNVQGLKRWIERGAEAAPEQWTERLERIEASVGQVLEQIAQVRANLNESVAETRPLQREACDLVALARGALEVFRHSARQHRLLLDARCPVLVGMWDAARICSIVERLLDNALKFSPDGGAITLLVERDGAEAVLRVQDGGIGIPARDLPHIFDRLHRGENVVGRFKGAGLGLFQARLDVVQHGGSIRAESPDGNGCAITVRLPIGTS